MSAPLLPVRASVALVSTAVGMVLLLNFKTPDVTRPRSPVAVIPAPTASSSPGSDSGQSGPQSSPSPSPEGGRYKDGQYTGQDFPNDYGDVQVKVIISGGRISDVQTVQMPFDRQRSAYISQVAGPLLHDEVLQAQSAQIDTISGATYTSDSYAQSLQSALDRAR